MTRHTKGHHSGRIERHRRTVSTARIDGGQICTCRDMCGRVQPQRPSGGALVCGYIGDAPAVAL